MKQIYKIYKTYFKQIYKILKRKKSNVTKNQIKNKSISRNPFSSHQ